VKNGDEIILSPEELKSIVEEVITKHNLAPWWGYALIIFLSFAGGFFGAFAKKKGEIAATKKYTEEIQKVAHQNQLLLEEHRTHNSLRMAAIDKRLQVHQQAYTLWKKLLSAVHSETIGSVVMECQSWWNENCLYLSPESREAFHTAFQCAFSHKDYLNVPSDLRDKILINSNFENITKAGEVIVRSVELPSLGEAEELDAGNDGISPNKAN